MHFQHTVTQSHLFASVEQQSEAETAKVEKSLMDDGIVHRRNNHQDLLV